MKEVEIWKPAKGFEDLYEVSNLGRVKSLIANRNGRKNIMKSDKILKPNPDGCGYYRVRLTGHDGKLHQWLIHRLVMVTFVREGNGQEQVNHINGIKSDNRLENLEWVSQSNNIKHAYHNGLMKPCDNGLKKGVVAFRSGQMVGKFNSIREMCRELKIDRRSVQRSLYGLVKNPKKYSFKLL